MNRDFFLCDNPECPKAGKCNNMCRIEGIQNKDTLEIKAPVFEILGEEGDEWVEIFPGVWELNTKPQVHNIFEGKEPTDDELGRPSNRP